MARRTNRGDSADDEGATQPAPSNTETLVGQSTAETTLLNAFSGGRLAHAWLFYGPRGIGKATLAYRFARYVLAHGGPAALGTFAPPQDASLTMAADNPVFRRVASGAHADLMRVERSWDEKRKRVRDEIVVADVRALAGFFAMTPAEGGWRIAIVDSADEMNRNAANALLKILEEPPKQGLLLLVSHAPGRLLPTIRSRCRKLALDPLRPDAIAALLEERAPDLSAVDRETLANLADGSFGRALEMAGQGGVGVYRELIGSLAKLPELDVPAIHALGDRLARRGAGASYTLFTELLVWWLARYIRHAASQSAMPPYIPGEDALVRSLTQRADLEQWVDVWEKISIFFTRAEAANLDKKQTILIVFSALSDAASGKVVTLPG